MERPTDPEDGLSRLLSESTVIYDQKNQPHWTLCQGARRAALRRMARTNSLGRVLEAHGRPGADAFQDALRAYLRGEAPPLERQDMDQLAVTLELVEALGGLLDGLPPAEEVHRQIDRVGLLQPFRDLVGKHFRGRKREIEALRAYVDALPSEGVVEAVGRFFDRVTSLKDNRPLLIYGPGGVGKSTLVSKFILDHVDRSDRHWVPFLYLDFDRPSVLAEDPVSILLEGVVQLGQQFPGSRDECEGSRSRWEERLRKEATRDSAGGLESALLRRERAAHMPTRERSHYAQEFAELYRKIVQKERIGDRPLLMVLDAFEGVQTLGLAFARAVGEFLEMLRHPQLLPELRCVLASRADLKTSPTEELPPFATQELPLEEFDSEAAVGYLASQEITDPQTAAALAAQVGGNPLSLKLAAEVYHKEGASALSEVGGGWRLFFAVDAAEIQGQLYRRILNHIDDLEVRALAHPGLVLRRVTAEVIRKVLSGPCGVAVPDDARAAELFEKLAKEVSLVTRERNVLTHRPDVRRVMLGQLRNDPEKRDLVTAIHLAAVAYYKDFDNPAARAEEIYHRLSLGQKSDTVRPRWDDRVGPLLAGALEELPPESRAFLATRLGVDVDAKARQQASLVDWEQNAARKADDLIRLNKPEEALAVLREHTERTPGSPLYLLEAAALDQLVEWDAAAAVLNRGIARALGRGHDAAVLELLTALGRVLRRVGNTKGAPDVLRKADQLAEGRRDHLARLVVTLERLRAMQVQDQPDPAEIESARRTAVNLLGVVSESELARQPGLLYGLAGTMGEAHPEVVRLAFRLAGVGAPSVLGRRILARALTTWDQIISADRPRPTAC